MPSSADKLTREQISFYRQHGSLMIPHEPNGGLETEESWKLVDLCDMALASLDTPSDKRVEALERVAVPARKLLRECQAMPPFSKVTKGWIVANLLEPIEELDALPSQEKP